MAVFGRTAPVRARRQSREVWIVAARGWQLLGLGAILALGGGAAQAENLDAGKPAPALFAATCAACHSSPRGLAKDRGSGAREASPGGGCRQAGQSKNRTAAAPAPDRDHAARLDDRAGRAAAAWHGR